MTKHFLDRNTLDMIFGTADYPTGGTVFHVEAAHYLGGSILVGEYRRQSTTNPYAPTRCRYCNRNNAHSTGECDGCGGPL